MEFKVYGAGRSLRVAFFGNFVGDRSALEKISECNDLEIHLFKVDHDDFVNSYSYEKHSLLNRKRDVLSVYEYILEYLKINNIKICLFFGSGYHWSREFLDKVKTISYTACYFADDPERSELTSKHYVKNFHYAFCGGIYFDKNTKIEEKYREWGARKSKFIPLGAYPAKYNEQLNDLNKRDIDLVYVGGCYFPKVFRMFRLKRYFGKRMLMYGRGWNESNNRIKTIILKAIKLIYGIPDIEELPKDKLVDLYQNTKIGFNIHMSYGPSNLRMYELPINGVMQICDCEKGLSELYDIDKEVVTYKTIDEAIDKIEHYLKNEDERIKIAQAGYEKAKNYYLVEETFKGLMDEIRSDINQNFKEYV
jgi:hypothetical protein